MEIRFPKIRKIVQSTGLDIIGAILILVVCIYRNFLGTIYYQGKIQFDTPLATISSLVSDGAYPLGIVASVGAVFSMLATRFVSKQKNSGNFIGVITTVVSGANDFLFGNRSAIITYPITFITHSLAYKKWSEGEKIKPLDRKYVMIIVVGMIVAFALVHLGAYWFGGKTDTAFLLIVSISFGLSLGGTISNIFKYQETWANWIVYNTVQLVKNAMIFNIANVAKYIFYLFNSVLTLVDWKFNGDIKDLKA